MLTARRQLPRRRGLSSALAGDPGVAVIQARPIGTRIGTRRISTGRDGVGRQLDRKAGKPQKTSFFGTRWYRPGRRRTHFETAPFRENKATPSREGPTVRISFPPASGQQRTVQDRKGVVWRDTEIDIWRVA